MANHIFTTNCNISENYQRRCLLLGLSDAKKKLGFKSLGVQIDYKTLVEEVPFPCILHWNKVHFVVVYKIDKQRKFTFQTQVMV